MLLRRRLPLARLAAAASAAAFAARSASTSPARADAVPAPAADEAKKADEKPKPCLVFHVDAEATKAILGSWPAQHARALASRVLLRPCIEVELERVPITPLAVVSDDETQSMLVAAPPSRLWHGRAEAPAGYPVLPISIEEDEEDEEEAAPSAPAPAAAPAADPPPYDPAVTAAIADAGADAAGASGAAAPAPTVWDQIESPWRQLEAAGVLVLTRDADAMPTAAALRGGATSWTGEVVTREAGSRRTRRLSVELVPAERAAELGLSGRTSAPECGFCRFMKNGPCGDAFVAWEACIDRARDEGVDFVEVCGKATLELKACTDAHPEYYGELSGGGADDDDGAAEAVEATGGAK